VWLGHAPWPVLAIPIPREREPLRQKQYQTATNINKRVDFPAGFGANQFMQTETGVAVSVGPGGDSPLPAGFGTSGLLSLLDSILRRREEFFAAIFEGQNLTQLIRSFFFAVVSLSAVYGLTMGASSLASGLNHGFLQMISSGLKVPTLYLLTLAVCYPVLFIILVLMGSRLSLLQTLALILLALTLNAVLLAAFAPIIAFFIITGSSYEFVKLLHVVVMTFSGFWAMTALWQGLREMCEKSNLYPKKAVRILQVWILVFGFVGTQMAWSLRPFVGAPERPFELFRAAQEGNFYTAVLHTALKLVKSE
jgi:hypothetical protein